MVSCVGVGPGNMGYLTQIARDRIASADLVAGFTSVVELIRGEVGGEAEVLCMSYKDQTEKLAEVARRHHTGAVCVVVFMGDIAFSGFQLLERVERACEESVEIIPGVSSAQILAIRARVCFDETSFITFHRRGNLQPFQKHLVNVLKDGRNAIVIPRPWDFMPKEIAKYLLDCGADPEHPTEVWENLTRNEAFWHGKLSECQQSFSDMSMMLIRGRHDLSGELEEL